MKQNIVNFEDKRLRDIDLDKSIFGLESKDEIIHRMIRYQLAKKRSGNHKTKGISEISGSTKKPFKQKGTGSARQGSRRSPQMRGGSVIFGPLVRSHAHKMPKKVRSLALKMALSIKFKSGKLKVLNDFKINKPKTSLLINKLSGLKINSALFVDGKEVEKNFYFAVKNVPNVDLLPAAGINVYDIVKRDHLILSEDALKALEERFKE
ncbi:MAG: 50S ribosomal protein L4 [Rickettsiales bacterium]|nr:50S ribosomal protein L4 [Rickettsiales bacterium]|tara:strand:+ start:418 stop:1041 length:624 start_codon:yes stop_codon:yes gene_type:complete